MNKFPSATGVRFYISHKKDGKMMTWTDEQIDTWCLSFRSYREDTSAVTKARDLQQQRGRVRQDILRNLATFLSGREALQGFLETLQQPAHADWNRFGIHGLSGSTFLKKLTQKCLQQEQLAQHLRSALLLPRDGPDGQQKMQTFSLFLEELIATG